MNSPLQMTNTSIGLIYLSKNNKKILLNNNKIIYLSHIDCTQKKIMHYE
jgi:hypothetical protein